MSISAVSCTPIKPQVSFGESKQETSYDVLASKAMYLEDTFNPKDKEQAENTKKSPIGTVASLATAVLLTYAGGKFAADKFSTLFKGPADKLAQGISKAADGKIIQGAERFLATKNGKVADYGQKAISKVSAGLKSPDALKKLAGIASVATFVPQIATIDKNGDGIRDISQRQVNSYKGVMENIGIFSEVIDALA